MTQNRSKPWAIVHGFWSKITENACFLLMKNNLKGVKIGQNRSKPWAIVHAFWPKMTEMHVFNKMK
jgi:hypothetical protein